MICSCRSHTWVTAATEFSDRWHHGSPSPFQQLLTGVASLTAALSRRGRGP